MSLIALPFLLLSAIGTVYTIVAAATVARFGRLPAAAPAAPEPVTLLKPLYGAEPRLADNLATFLRQRWTAPVEMVAGVQRLDDPAVAVARRLDGDVRIVIDDTAHGANAKVSNLVNMMPFTTTDLLVLSDSDMSVGPDYLATLAATLAQPGVGAVTCVYRGRGDAGFWSVLSAAAVSYQFLPSVLVGLRFGLADPCMGSTIALRRDTLARIGGFESLRDVLADDYQIGVGVRALGLRVAVPPMVVTHSCDEPSLRALAAHELRWTATIRGIDPIGHIGQIATHPLAFALLALPFAPLGGAIALIAGLAARLALVTRVDRLVGTSSAPRRLILLRDCLSFALFVASFFARSVEWRGLRLRIGNEGRIAPEPEN
ncbi:bacteriohopanetetrol glucosamine biosynthesis glycosyltransferase HpnI [Sphingomonas nostoxanthinifaciens]|uniref:bacteriohopanetetrol glucosamine biosynthesis glycosyltransferase HpnI n=1 Tax=Sphingomonas nostoxanthinifaciens TaxID=2872652 RepID=UPI001CC216BC|nr:bacteriohopanetetrol glucosamine biosynthesis glycosyltransferase HpnI [Sphingomonas nostoxanthinifaciens]UAK23502.1 bacteriohopanetetrol glucosamine biosynthesis glycosyltransferase HpnI [Sphingomonas nostoxanthinifaciens]